MLNKNKIIVLIITAALILISASSLFAGAVKDAQLLFNNGNDYFLNKDYENARANYEQALGAGYNDPSVYYNLANSYIFLGNIGKAVLNLQRGMALEPRSEDIINNLSTLNTIIYKDIATVGANKRPMTFKRLLLRLKLFTRDELAIAIIIFYMLFFIFGVMRKTKSHGKFRMFAGTISAVSFLITLIVIIIFVGGFYFEYAFPQAVIMKNVTLRSSPSDNEAYRTQIELKEGMVVELKRTHSGWSEVSNYLINKEGWVKLDALERI